MIAVRVDDFPQTKGESQHSLSAFREFNRELVSAIGLGNRYLLGVIPGRCSVDDVMFLRNETDCVIGMHGIDHDEGLLDVHRNEFPSYLSKLDVRKRLIEARTALELGVGRPVTIYMPPRNLIDMRTASVLNGQFRYYTGGPETDRSVIDRFPTCIMSMPPFEYGRSDELLHYRAHEKLVEKSDAGHIVVLALHWTWETNIGLEHMKRFLSQIPSHHFMDFGI